MGLWKTHFHWNVLLRWEVLGWIIGAVLAAAAFMLGFDQFWGAEMCFVIVAVLVFAKITQLAVVATDPVGHRLLFTFVLFGLCGIGIVETIRAVNRWAQSKQAPKPTPSSSETPSAILMYHDKQIRLQNQGMTSFYVWGASYGNTLPSIEREPRVVAPNTYYFWPLGDDFEKHVRGDLKGSDGEITVSFHAFVTTLESEKLTLRGALVVNILKGQMSVRTQTLPLRNGWRDEDGKEIPDPNNVSHGRATLGPQSALEEIVPLNFSLKIRPSPGDALKGFTELRGYTHYRMEIYNSGSETAHNVKVKLIEMEPLPIAENFRARADFPYPVRPAHLADGNINTSEDRDINPGTSERFELLFFWESSEQPNPRIMVDGIDTKQERQSDARFSIEEDECWRLKYEVSSAEGGIQNPIFLARREEKNMFMSRLA